MTNTNMAGGDTRTSGIWNNPNNQSKQTQAGTIT